MMHKQSFINALLAEAYIVTLVSLMNVGPKGVEHSFIMPILMLSLFVLSAAVMGYLFLSMPLQLYVDGKKKEAVTFFLHTLFSFAGIGALTLMVWVVLLSLR